MQILPRIYLVGGISYHLTYTDWPSGDCNVYVVDTRDGLVMVDCGCGETLPEILRHIRLWGLDPSDITHLLLTHEHFNHAGAADGVRRTGAKTVAHLKAADAVENGTVETARYVSHMDFVACEIDVKVDGGDSVEQGECELEVLHLPGHTHGCVGYKLVRDNTAILFTGDVVADQGLTGRRISPSYNQAAYLQSLQQLMQEPADVLLTGHGPVCLSRGHVWIERCFEKAVKEWDVSS